MIINIIEPYTLTVMKTSSNNNDNHHHDNNNNDGNNCDCDFDCKNVNNVIYVDSEYFVSDPEVENRCKPTQFIKEAIDLAISKAATNLDNLNNEVFLIHVRPGTYNEINILENLNDPLINAIKNIHFYFESGATVNGDTIIFDIPSTSILNSVDIKGYGKFMTQNSLYRVDNINSSLSFQADLVEFMAIINIKRTGI